MPADKVTVLMLGDVYASSGLGAVSSVLPKEIALRHADFVVINGENAADGFGMLKSDADELFAAGADVITSGNHIWQAEEILPYLDEKNEILRPANYPEGLKGHGLALVEKKGVRYAVLNLLGRHNLAHVDCPFRVADRELEKIQSGNNDRPIVLVDFHAEETDEKEALGFYLDGRVSAVVGTHTHVQTADEKILPKGTAYITDLGMCGAKNSIIGGTIEASVERNATQMPLKIPPATGVGQISGVVIEIDVKSGKALSIERFIH